MKIHIYLIFAFTLIFSSCTLLKEERAELLISQCLKDYLTYPESYEAISTQVDSTNINVEIIEEMLELVEEILDLNSNIKSCEGKSAYFYFYKKDVYEEYILEIQRLTQKQNENVSNLREMINNLYDEEFNGWIVSHRFRALDDDGENSPPQEMIFLCDVDFEYCQGWELYEYNIISQMINSVIDIESNKVLIDNLERLQLEF